MSEITPAIEHLAQTMNQPVKDVAAFIACLKVWTDKGYSVEQAIEKHMAQMSRFIDHAVRLSRELKPLAVEWFFEGRDQA